MILMLIVFWIVFVFVVVKIQKHYDKKIEKMYEEHDKWIEDFFRNGGREKK